MNIDKAKSIIMSNYRIHHKFIYRGSRNQNEEISGFIEKIYPVVFLIRMDNQDTRCFSYYDVITGNLKIVI